MQNLMPNFQATIFGLACEWVWSLNYWPTKIISTKYSQSAICENVEGSKQKVVQLAQ